MADSAKPTWSVVSQREDFGPNAAGNYVQGVVVSFRTASGSTGSVFVPAAEYTVDRVREVVDSAAKAMQAVDSLQG